MFQEKSHKAGSSQTDQSSPRLRVLPWTSALLPQVTELLAQGWDKKTPLDLSRIILVVPTRQSGRRLRESLAIYANQFHQAVFPPKVLLPESLLNSLVEASGTQATRIESLLAWIEVLQGLELENFSHVFPVDPPERTFSWALRVSQDFDRLKTTLAEGGLRFGEVAEKAGEDFEEALRWTELGEIERQYTALLTERQLSDSRDRQMAVARNPPAAPGDCDRIILAGCPDPLTLALRVVEGWSAMIPVEIWVFGPEAGSEELFDRWGRPIEAKWENRELQLRDFEKNVRLCGDPRMQAERIGTSLRNYPSPESHVAVGLGDPELVAVVDRELVHAGYRTFNPEGRAGAQDALYFLLRALAQFEREFSFESFQRLARCPDFLECLTARGIPGDQAFSVSRFLNGLDEVHANHLPPTLTEALRHAKKDRNLKRFPEVPVALEFAQTLHLTLSKGEFAESVFEAMRVIFFGRAFDLSKSDDATAKEAVEAFTDILLEVEKGSAKVRKISVRDGWELALPLFAGIHRPLEKEPGAIELLGWLELLWEDAPHLVVAGMNDGKVPDAVVGDNFLPESLREKLGLRTNARRFARDAYLLQALAASRTENGVLELLVGKTSEAGDPLRPSRLLFACSDLALPSRVEFLFKSVETARPGFAWSRAWKLTPRKDAVFPAISVTAFRDYLNCPFRFYLKHGLRMEAVDANKGELDAMDFGNACHATLEMLGKNEGIKSSVDEREIQEFLVAELERYTRERYGRNLSLPLTIQLESARQRLRKAAEIQARERAAGWLIMHTEQKFEVTIDGIVVRGKIDRIDQNESTGAWRIIDYKTSDKPDSPPAAHFEKVRAQAQPEAVRPYAIFEHGEELHRWTDLQLPLYQHFFSSDPRFTGDVTCGYFNLPKAAGETSLQLWHQLTPELLARAMECVRGVLGDITARRFWPPADIRERNDDFNELFHLGALESVNWQEAGK